MTNRTSGAKPEVDKGGVGSSPGSEAAIAAILADYGTRLMKLEEGAGEILSLLKGQGGEIEGRIMEAQKGAVADGLVALKKDLSLEIAEATAQILADAKDIAAAGRRRSIIPDSGREDDEPEMTKVGAAAVAEIPVDELFAFKLYPDRLVVVTTAGRKITVQKP